MHGNEHRLGILRWRGQINWKDVTERVIAGSISGTFAGLSFWRKLRRLGWPTDPPLQVLCMSCNSKKAAEERATRTKNAA